jgi:hypothetical protein
VILPDHKKHGAASEIYSIGAFRRDFSCWRERVSAANAADVYAREGSLKDEPAYMPAITWSGFYVGAHVGGVFGDEAALAISASGEEGAAAKADLNDTWLAGVYVGHNWQRSNIVFGVEGDWSFLATAKLRRRRQLARNHLMTIGSQVFVAVLAMP